VDKYIRKKKFKPLKSSTNSRAIVLSYSNLLKDSRVLRQIKWLRDADYEVDAVGLGKKPPLAEIFFEIAPPKLIFRLLIYLFAYPKLRSDLILKSVIDSDLLASIKAGMYDLVVINDLDFLALEGLFRGAEVSGTRVILDLHEYFPDVGGSFIYKMLHGKYHRHLQSLITKRNISTFITVSPDIAALYSKKLGKSFVSVENMPEPLNATHQEPRKTTQNANEGPRSTQLVYHGNPGRGRGLYHLILAMRRVQGPTDLNLVLTGPKYKSDSLKIFSKLVGARSKVRFWPPVTPEEVPEFLSKFDLEVIFFPPPHTTSINLSLPNKFFESLASGMGVVVGPNPTMSRIVKQFGCGLVLNDWTISGLAQQLTKDLDKTSITKWKTGSRLTLMHYSMENTRAKFLRSIQGK
jgi:glycosyltransferase involved in cell wall biosynthesis